MDQLSHNGIQYSSFQDSHTFPKAGRVVGGSGSGSVCRFLVGREMGAAREWRKRGELAVRRRLRVGWRRLLNGNGSSEEGWCCLCGGWIGEGEELVGEAGLRCVEEGSWQGVFC
ncbi:hypothetical protein OIU74_007232 [Salix koriyanagi]|uniref:Uncharacterized protein n=1 Tax=Salix koriyanagi TaxID=2511006 RepID=A0A9Q0Z5U9_9ROSI|nr:hypothetical protein OIU74_007232 [Salix koriyanagi]